MTTDQALGNARRFMAAAGAIAGNRQHKPNT